LRLLWALGFAATGILFIAIDLPLAAGLCFVAAGFIAAIRLLAGTGKAVKTVSKGATKGMWTGLSKAETAGPAFDVGKEGLDNAADLVGQQAFAGSQKDGRKIVGDQYQFKFKGLGRLAGASQKLIDSFKKIFK